MKKVPSITGRKGSEWYAKGKQAHQGVSLGRGHIEGEKELVRFYKRLIKEHFYLGWRRGTHDKISMRLNDLRKEPQAVNYPDGKSFILQQEALLLCLTETITEEAKDNIVKMTESEDEDNLYVAEMVVLNYSLERVKALGKATCNTRCGLENYAYAKKHYYNELMPNAIRIMESEQHDYSYWEEYNNSYKYYKQIT